MSRKHHLIDINIKIHYIYVNIIYVQLYHQKEKKNIVWIIKIYLYVATNLIKYVIVIDF